MLVKSETQYQSAGSRAKFEAALRVRRLRHLDGEQRANALLNEPRASKEDLDEEESPTEAEYQPKGYLRVLRDKLKEEI
jgi:hypothetical protein